jgi:hypothetical protein
MSNIYTVLRSSPVIVFGSVTNMAHISTGFRRLDNSFKLSNPSTLFYPKILLGRRILPQNPTQRLDVPRTKVTFSLSVFPRNSISPPCRIRRSNNRREYPNPVRDAPIGHDPRQWRRLALHAALHVRHLKPRCRPPLDWKFLLCGSATYTSHRRRETPVKMKRILMSPGRANMNPVERTSPATWQQCRLGSAVGIYSN